MPGKVKIYRYENDSGRGPYTGWHNNPLLEEALQHHSLATGRPPPQHDGLDMSEIPWYWRSGFLYMEDLQRWFDGVHELLRAAGFQIATYEVQDTDIFLGSSQVVFLPE